MTGPVDQAPETPTRPPDVDTGFWLWVAALPLMVIGYVIDVAGSPTGPPVLRYATAGLVSLVLSTVVVTFLLLMRHGYRWTRTVLTGGGVASVVYAVTNLFTVDRMPPAALAYAATAIFGSVLILGGAFLLHRRDATAWFTR